MYFKFSSIALFLSAIPLKTIASREYLVGLQAVDSTWCLAVHIATQQQSSDGSRAYTFRVGEKCSLYLLKHLRHHQD